MQLRFDDKVISFWLELSLAETMTVEKKCAQGIQQDLIDLSISLKKMMTLLLAEIYLGYVDFKIQLKTS